MGIIGNVIEKIVCYFISLYQCCISPLLRPHCRFEPSCSNYALEAIRVQGIYKGLLLLILRLCRCHPWGQCGYDPVPPIKENKL